jgi:hypothetical protein
MYEPAIAWRTTSRKLYWQGCLYGWHLERLAQQRLARRSYKLEVVKRPHSSTVLDERCTLAPGKPLADRASVAVGWDTL